MKLLTYVDSSYSFGCVHISHSPQKGRKFSVESPSHLRLSPTAAAISSSSMAKKKARSSSPPLQGTPVTEKQKPGHEIEEIFKKKRKKPEKAGSTPESLNVEQDKSKKIKKEKKSNEKPKKKKASFKGDIQNDPLPRPRRRTQEGLTIYSADELGVGNPDAGGTPLCPFDCSCCF